MEYLFIYCLQLFNTLTAIKIGLIIILILGGFAHLMCKFKYLSDKKYYSEIKEGIDVGEKMLSIILILSIILCLAPTRNTMLMLGGMYLGKKAVKTVITDDKIKKIDTIINLELDKRIVELKEGKE